MTRIYDEWPFKQILPIRRDFPIGMIFLYLDEIKAKREGNWKTDPCVECGAIPDPFDESKIIGNHYYPRCGTKLTGKGAVIISTKNVIESDICFRERKDKMNV